MLKAIRIGASVGLIVGSLLQGNLVQVAQAQSRPLTLTQQVDQLQQAVCQQNWAQALSLISPIIGSSQLSDVSRSEYVKYRHTLQSYHQSNARFQSMPGCGEGLATAPTQDDALLSLPLETSTSSFDWEGAVNRLETQMTLSDAARTNVPAPSTARAEMADPSFASAPPEADNSEEEEIVFKPSQGIFFYNSRVGNPDRIISGNLVSQMPIVVNDLRLVYDIYRQVEVAGVNAGVLYDYQRTASESVASSVEVGQQPRILLNQEGEFYRIVGIGWLENGDRAYTFLHESEGGQSGVCSQLWSSGYSCSTARQAKNPGFY